jgi:serine/threonine protein kinase
MAPEQVLGEGDIDGRADLYSVGLIAYELLTGGNPYESPTVMDTLIKQVTAPPPPFNPALNIPENLSKIIFRALEKKARNRFQNVREFRNACSTIIADLAPVAPLGSPVLPIPSPVITGFNTQTAASGPTIVCLDDDQGFLNIFSFLLQREGFRVITAASFESLYEPISDPSVRLLITDVLMPDIPGSKVCKLIKNARPDISILLLSGMPEDELIRLVTESNADGFLSKGTQPTRWIPRIRQILGN